MTYILASMQKHAHRFNCYIEQFYNRIRIHQTLGYRTPDQFESEWHGAQLNCPRKAGQLTTAPFIYYLSAYPGPFSVRPLRTPVCLPSSTTTCPLTNTCEKPVENWCGFSNVA